MFRLKELRIENGLKRSELAKIMHIPLSTLTNYENETRQPPYSLLIEFAKYFDESIDYILGYEKKDSSTHENNLNKIDSPLSREEKELISNYRSCDGLGKSRILETSEIWKKFGNKI